MIREKKTGSRTRLLFHVTLASCDFLCTSPYGTAAYFAKTVVLDITTGKFIMNTGALKKSQNTGRETIQ
jgi:hypothetical protein